MRDSCDRAHQHKNLPQYSSRWSGLRNSPKYTSFQSVENRTIITVVIAEFKHCSYQCPPQAFLAVLPLYTKRPLKLQDWKNKCPLSLIFIP